MSFKGTELVLEFQEEPEGLTFATIVQSMFDTSDVADRICLALESLGWKADDDSIG